METLVAYTFAYDSAARAAAGRDRVEAYYGARPEVNPSDERPNVDPLFELQLPDGCVWTNRPVAALLFAGVPAVASSRGWTFAAGCGWFMADSTPYDGVLAVSGTAHIVADGHRQQGTDVRLIEQALSWHRYAEGLQPASSLFDTPPDGFIAGEPIGEVANGYFYPRDVDQLDALPLPDKLRAFSNHLRTRLIPAAGPTQAARAAVTEQIDRVLRTAVDNGIEDATMLDYFYAVEPLRRGAAPFTPVHKNLASAADRDLIEPLLADVEGFGDLSTLWAASIAGASSPSGEATLRQALWRATFDQHLAEVNK
ncbi:hypothetical protein [Kribbella jiaozuonensis]|uniref:Uncharacterized protein n=1 Tax=Kribbella jiaozuonensis TaxID=2575441 RepID=A0A4V5UVU4_9ACTN|nr:hypothetical protein [Kribbella jiaozuonensis]TKK74433.1 hypothetical protein FDA38_37285 [Kribbella jiaozuonensis]